MDAVRIYADVAASGAKDYNSRNQWDVLDEMLTQGDVLAVAAIDRLGRRYLETMWSIYDLQRHGIRLRSLADNEVEWTKYPDAAPTRPRPSWATSWPTWRPMWRARSPEHQPQDQGRDRTPPGRRERS